MAGLDLSMMPLQHETSNSDQVLERTARRLCRCKREWYSYAL